MTEEKTNVKKLDPEKRSELLKNMTETYEVLELQAKIAEARSRIKRANVEEILLALKYDELKNGHGKPESKEDRKES